MSQSAAFQITHKQHWRHKISDCLQMLEWFAGTISISSVMCDVRLEAHLLLARIEFSKGG